jgi:hypothetical protein
VCDPKDCWARGPPPARKTNIENIGSKIEAKTEQKKTNRKTHNKKAAKMSNRQ